MKTKLALLAVLTTVFSFLAVQTGALPLPARALEREPDAVLSAAAYEAVAVSDETDGPSRENEASPSPEPSPTPEPTPAPTPEPTAEPTPSPEDAEDGPVPLAATTIRASGPIKNTSALSADPDALLAGELIQRLPSEGAQILIIHTHGTEAYSPEPGSEYETSGDWRSTDSQYNVLRVGEALAQALEARGLSVIHDTGLYDYPSYNGSYNRCAEAIEAHLAQNPGIAVVIDLHRDALGTEELMYKTLAEGTEEPTAQLMLVMGTDENLEHPLWQENLKLALHLQEAAQTLQPSLMRPIHLCAYRYNQQLTTGSLILEVGTCGNSMEEALRAAELFAEAAAPVLLALVE